MAQEITAKSDVWAVVLLIVLAIFVVWLFFFGGIYSITGIFGQ
jgi:predicted Abi (CAAX) family protease